MTHLTKKMIGGKGYFYLVKSIRLPNGSVSKIYKSLGTKKPSKMPDTKEYFLRKENQIYIDFALNNFKEDKILSSEEIKKLELMRLAYRKILKTLNKQQLKDLFDRFTVNFTYESNAIEGNSLTLKDVGVIIFENVSIKGKNLREIYETRNSRAVVDMILRKKFDVSHKSMLKMHRMLMRDMDINYGYKKIPNFILGKRLETTPPEKVYDELNKLIKWYEINKGKLHPLVLAAHFHGKFEKIHPFDDGNGRVGRFLINVILVDSGYMPIIIRKSSRTAYLSCLEAFDNGHEDKIKRFLLEKFKDTYRKFFEVYLKYI